MNDTTTHRDERPGRDTGRERRANNLYLLWGRLLVTLSAWAAVVTGTLPVEATPVVLVITTVSLYISVKSYPSLADDTEAGGE